jgi:hypothetical protein
MYERKHSNTSLYKILQQNILMPNITTVLAISVLIALIILVTPVALAANNQVQVVFKGTAFGTFGTPSQPGVASFSIWCKLTPGQNVNSYSTDCTGSMSFPALGITKGVSGEEGITQPVADAFLIHVQSRGDDGQSVDCTLSNIPPVTKGSTNTVNVHCSSIPTFGDGSTNKAVVTVTGALKIQ